jgi:hypothetical protein
LISDFDAPEMKIKSDENLLEENVQLRIRLRVVETRALQDIQNVLRIHLWIKHKHLLKLP